MVITLCHGNSPDKRVVYPVSANELSDLAKSQGLIVKAVTSDSDKLCQD